MTAFFPGDNPTILYNPHFDPKLSSWYDLGKRILEYFYERPQYNLIFAPHVMLFQKRAHISLTKRHFRFSGGISEKYSKCQHMLIDTGSDRSVNMAYTLNADVYLGDASSQVYEFLVRPRPCIFINSHGADWRHDPNYAHWRLGPVIDSPDKFDSILADIDTVHARYREAQVIAFEQTFDLSGNSSDRAARAIVDAITRWMAKR